MPNEPEGPLGPPIILFIFKLLLVGGAVAAFAVDHRTTIAAYAESLPPIPLEYGVEPAVFYLVHAVAVVASE